MTMKTFYKHLAPALMASSLLILAACQGSSQDVESQIAKVGQRDGSEVMAQIKPDDELQSMKLDPTLLPVYKNTLKSIFHSLGEASGSSWEKLFGIKNWYMGPASAAKKFPAPIGGFTFQDTSSYVIQQSEGDVFVDKALFDKLKEEDQRDAVLLEFLASLYSIRKVTDDELCTLMKRTFEVKECVSTSGTRENEHEDVETTEVSKRTRIAEVLSVNEDYGKIKAVAKFILEQGASGLKGQEVLDLMLKNGFNTKIFSYALPLEEKETEVEDPTEGPSGSEAITPKLEVTKEIFHTLMSQLQEAKALPLNCVFSVDDQKDAVPCTVSLATKTMGNPPAGLYGLTLKFEDKTIESTAYLTTSQDVVAHANYIDAVTEEVYAVFPLRGEKLESPEVGSRYRATFLVAKKILVKDVESLMLVNVVSVPGVVTEVSADKKICEGKVDMDSSFEKLAYMIQIKTDITADQGLLTKLPAKTPCW